MSTRVTQTPVVDAARFRRALGRPAAGVVVVVVTGPGPVGGTARHGRFAPHAEPAWVKESSR
jgi:hypothetical protein